MKYLACDVINPKNEKVINRYLYGVAISQLGEWDKFMSLEDHKKYIKKEVYKRIGRSKRLKKKVEPCNATIRLLVITYKDLIKSGIDFEVFHPPGFQIRNSIDPFPKGKDNTGRRF